MSDSENEVEAILDKRFHKGCVYYLVKWAGHEGDDSEKWIQECKLNNCRKLIDKFEGRNDESSSNSSSEIEGNESEWLPDEGPSHRTGHIQNKRKKVSTKKRMKAAKKSKKVVGNNQKQKKRIHVTGKRGIEEDCSSSEEESSTIRKPGSSRHKAPTFDEVYAKHRASSNYKPWTVSKKHRYK